jgi:hypothetical protein
MSIIKARNIRLSSIIRFGSELEPFNLIDVTSDADGQSKTVEAFLNSPGTYVYETRFTVNERDAFRMGVTGIRFEFFVSKPNAGEVALKENDFIIEIKKPPLSSPADPVNIQKAAVFLKSSLLRDLAAVAQPLKAISLQQPIASMIFKDAARSSESLNKKDPAQSLASGKVLGTTPKNVLNFGTQQTAPSQVSQNFDSLGTKSSSRSLSLFEKRAGLKSDRQPAQDSIVNSFLNLKQIVDPNTLVRTLPVAMVEVLSNNVEYTRQLTFEKSNLKGYNKIYVRVSGITRSTATAVVEKRNYVIAHSSELSDFLGNPEPPTIVSVESSFGRASFTLRKTDPTLRRVSVVRITKNPNRVESTFERLATLEFGEKDTIEYSDSVDNVAPNVVIYRFMVQNEDGSSGEFSSTVLTSFTKVSDQKKVLSSTTPISIRAINTVDGIGIDVDTINDQVYSLRLLRQDLGMIGEFSDTITTILDSANRSSQIVAGEKTTLTFLDADVIPGRHYRYFAAYRLGSGSSAFLCQETLSDEDETIVRQQPSASMPFVAAMTPASYTQDENNSITIQFETSVQEVENQYNTLLDALRLAGVSQQFVSDLQNDRQKLKQVAAFLIERVDRVTGRRISFGIYSPGKFFDSPETRSKLKLPDLVPGRKYEYICKLCIRPDSTFLLTATTGFTAYGSSAGNITEVLAAKFQNALISRGILPSEKVLRDGITIRENFFLGLTGLEISSSTTLPVFAPKVESLTIKERKTYNLLRWSTVGDASNTSYFLVYCNYNGTDELLGTVSSLGTNTVYQYKDTRFYDEVGQKSYFVKIVTLDHDVSVSSSKIETITEFSIPVAVLDGYILSPSRYETKGVILQGPGPKFSQPGAPAKVDVQQLGTYEFPKPSDAVNVTRQTTPTINTNTLSFDTKELLAKPDAVSSKAKSEFDFIGKKIADTAKMKEVNFYNVPPVTSRAEAKLENVGIGSFLGEYSNPLFSNVDSLSKIQENAASQNSVASNSTSNDKSPKIGLQLGSQKKFSLK